MIYDKCDIYEDLNNYRPISNLKFISKIQSNEFTSVNQFFLHSFQSTYRSFHSTESTHLKIHNDIISSINNGVVTALILLDLSAAFDTVDHSILLSRLKSGSVSKIPVCHGFLRISTQDTISSYSTLSCGVPQGFVLGPLLSTLYDSSGLRYI